MEDDIFHDVVMAEERSHAAGFQSGFEKGKVQGCLGGYGLGVEKGLALGSELGFYLGFVEKVQKNGGLDEKPRVKSLLESLAEMITKFPLSNALSESLFEDLEKIRAKFKQLMSLMGASPRFGNVTEKAKGISF